MIFGHVDSSPRESNCYTAKQIPEGARSGKPWVTMAWEAANRHKAPSGAPSLQSTGILDSSCTCNPEDSWVATRRFCNERRTLNTDG